MSVPGQNGPLRFHTSDGAKDHAHSNRRGKGHNDSADPSADRVTCNQIGDGLPAFIINFKAIEIIHNIISISNIRSPLDDLAGVSSGDLAEVIMSN